MLSSSMLHIQAHSLEYPLELRWVTWKELKDAIKDYRKEADAMNDLLIQTTYDIDFSCEELNVRTKVKSMKGNLILKYMDKYNQTLSK